MARNLFASPLYPLPINGQLTNNYLNTTRSAINGDQFDIKLDANLTAKDHLFGRFSWSRQDTPTNNSFPLVLRQLKHSPHLERRCQLDANGEPALCERGQGGRQLRLDIQRRPQRRSGQLCRTARDPGWQ